MEKQKEMKKYTARASYYNQGCVGVLDTDYRRAGEGRQDDKKKDDRKCFKCQRTGDIARDCNGQGAKGRKICVLLY